MNSRDVEYAVYKGDTLLVLGKAEQCADFLGVKPTSIQWYSTPTWKKRSEKFNQDNVLIAEKIMMGKLWDKDDDEE